MRISIEIVPRVKESFVSNVALIKSNFSTVDSINIPDLQRYDIRSWEASVYAQKYYQNTIPHIRAIDINLKEHLAVADKINELGIKEILLVSGDSPQEITKKIYPTSSIDVIERFKKTLPHIKVYAAIDQYRDSFRKELDYINAKIDAGADGFFFQPFFDLRLLKIWAEKLNPSNIFFGISPVLSEQSINYWQIKNSVIFPADFCPTLKWNTDFGREAADFVRVCKGNLYIMPIKVNLLTYLKSLIE